MSMGVENLVGLRYQGKIYTGVISQWNQQLVSKGIVCLCIPIIGKVRSIWDKEFFKIRVYFYGMVRRKKVLSDSRHRIEIHLDVYIDVVVEVIEVHSSVIFDFCSWWGVHGTLVGWSFVWESTCHIFLYNVHLPMVRPSC